MALVIIGVGVLAFVDAQASFTRSNGWSSQAATAMLLANEIRELSRRLPRHDPVTGLTLTATGGGGTLLTGWGTEAGEVDVDDIDDLDDLDGKVFGEGGDFPGPIDAFGGIIPRIGVDGVVLTDDGDPLPLSGWTQRVTVEKVDPYNVGTVRVAAYQQAASTTLPAIAVDQFPLRITVVVEHQGLGDAQATEVTRVTWVIPS